MAGTPSRHREPFQTIQLDLLGPVAPPGTDGSRYVLTISCPYSRYVFLKTLPDKHQNTVAQAILHCLLEIGAFPIVYQSDRGREFLNAVLRELTGLLGGKQVFSPAYTPRVQGIVESSHKVLGASLAMIAQSRLKGQLQAWPETIPLVQHLMRETPLGGTMGEVCAADLIHGWRRLKPLHGVLHPLLEQSPSVPQSEWLRDTLFKLHEVHAHHPQVMRDGEDALQRRLQTPGWIPAEGDLVFLELMPAVRSTLLDRADGPFLVSNVRGHRCSLQHPMSRELLHQEIPFSRLIPFPYSPETEVEEGPPPPRHCRHRLPDGAEDLEANEVEEVVPSDSEAEMVEASAAAARPRRGVL